MPELDIEIEDSPEYISSLKSLETENTIDRIFYRPIGFWIARHLQHTPISPNTITIISIFVGMAGAWCFFYPSLWTTVLAILLMMSANILDCVDGQLARLTGRYSPIGRILDGMAGDFWFITLYVALSLRIYNEYGYWFIFVIAFLSMLSHFQQAFITDYYKTLHLRFISPETGKEFTTYDQIKERYAQMVPGYKRFFFKLYVWYTYLQSGITPDLQAMLVSMRRHDITKEDRSRFRAGSRIIMKLVDLMTFNGRTIPLFIFALSGQIWFYFVYEVFFLNIVFFTARKQHEMLCREFTASIERATPPSL